MWWSLQQALDAAGNLPRGQYLRWDVREYQPGDKLPVSRVWVDGTPTSRVLKGTSVIDPHSRRLKNLPGLGFRYYEGYVYIVQGDYLHPGHDPGEVIIGNATVVRRLL